MATQIEFEKLQFKKNWNNASDFPTFEDDEAKVRADMQALHDETRDFLNDTLIPSVEETLENLAVPGTGDMKAEVYDPTGKRTDVYKYAEDYTERAIAEKTGGYMAYTEGEAPTARSNKTLYGKILADYREVKENV
jgi:hypothetical protein